MKWITVSFLLMNAIIVGYCQSSAQCNDLTRFTCNDGICITKARVCNGYWDCEEGEDEVNCASECSDVPPNIENSVSYAGNRSLHGTKSSSSDKGPFLLGDVIKYDCKEDMHLVGPLPRCNGRKQWSNETPICISLSECGRAGKRKIFENQRNFYRDVGGEDAEENLWPWQILITLLGSTPEQTLNKNHLLGGGSLLNKKWVLTAAHLFTKAGSSPDWFRSFVISAGVYELPSGMEKLKKSVQMYTPSAGYIHKDFDPGTYENDIALLKIGGRYDLSMSIIPNNTKGVKYAFNVRPVCIPCTGVVDEELLVDDLGNSLINRKMPLSEKCDVENTFLPAENENVFVTGFGHVNKAYRYVTRKKMNPPKYLQQAETKIGGSESCHMGIERINNRRVNNPMLSYSDKLLCTISKSDSTDACQGDSGGPLVREIPFNNSDESVWVQVGIVSFGYGCGLDYPSFYTNVAHYLLWINETMDSDQSEHCSSIPCENDGSCVNRMQTYTCFCTIDFEGPTCDTDIKCPRPQSTIPKGKLVGTSPLAQNLLLPGSTALYTCKPKYKMAGFTVVNSKSTMCYRRHGRSYWEPDPSYQIKCIPITCRNPPFQSNQHAVGDKTFWRVDETVEIECDDKYAFEALSAQTIFTCGNDGRWHGTVTKCRDSKCRDPLNFITNGKRTHTSWWWEWWFPTPNDTVRYQCNKNYKVYGVEKIQQTITITCIGTTFRSPSWWSTDPSKIRCVDIECASPVLRSHQTLDRHLGKWKVNSVATYRCGHGYDFLSGPVTRTITCKSNESWTAADGNNECIKEE